MNRIIGLSGIIVLVLMLLVAGCSEPDHAEAPEADPEEEATEPYEGASKGFLRIDKLVLR